MADDRSCDGAGPSGQQQSSPRVVLLSGAASGLLARFFTHPLDTVKARLQVQSALHTGALRALPLPYKSTGDALAKLAAQEGLAGFYRGFSAVVAAAPLASAVYFGGYELTKRLLMAGDAEREVALPPAAVYMASGVAAQACAGLIYTPMDVVKERMQVQAMLQQQRGSAGRALPVLFASSAACFAAILRAEGPRGAWRGYWAANAAWWPWNIMYFVSYEHLRDLAAADGAFGAPGDKAALPPLVSATAATLAATLATIATNPIDVVKTRLQALPGGAGSAGGALGVARAMYAAEGAAVFGAGLAARVLSIAPGSFISFFAFETCRAAFAAREAQRNADDDAGREMPLRRIEL